MALIQMMMTLFKRLVGSIPNLLASSSMSFTILPLSILPSLLFSLSSSYTTKAIATGDPKRLGSPQTSSVLARGRKVHTALYVPFANTPFFLSPASN